MKLTLERIKNLIKEELSQIRESDDEEYQEKFLTGHDSEEKEAFKGLTRKDITTIKTELYQMLLDAAKNDEERASIKQNLVPADVKIRTKRGSNALKYVHNNITYYGEI